jgi:hypothetical protein
MLWRERGRQQLESFQLAPWASRRRRDLLELWDGLHPTITELTQWIEQEVVKYPAAQRLMTHPGAGALSGAGHGTERCPSNPIEQPAPLRRGVRTSNQDRGCGPKRCMGRIEFRPESD